MESGKDERAMNYFMSLLKEESYSVRTVSSIKDISYIQIYDNTIYLFIQDNPFLLKLLEEVSKRVIADVKGKLIPEEDMRNGELKTKRDQLEKQMKELNMKVERYWANLF